MDNIKIWQELEGMIEEGQSGLRVGCNDYRTFNNMSLYVKALMSSVERKNSWQLAEMVGAKTPYNFQYLLCYAAIDVVALKKALIKITIENLGTQGYLTFDDTGFLKKGDQSSGVQRQYTGTAGRVENCQIGTFMGYKTQKGHNLLDGKLYLPESWLNDPQRCRKAGIPEGLKFEKKALQAAGMYKSFKEQGYECSWVTADEAYGKDPDFVKVLEEYNQPYILAVPKDYSIRCGDLKQRFEALKCAESADVNLWEMHSAGKGSKGERVYEWLLIKRNEINSFSEFEKFLLIRRSMSTGELAFYSVMAPKNRSLQELAMAAGSRWSIEECFEMAKGETGLDQYEVRSYRGWERHTTFSMWALMILVNLKNKVSDPANLANKLLENNKKPEILVADLDKEQASELVLASGAITTQELSAGQEQLDSMHEYKKKQKILSALRFKKLDVL
ncbi:IS701 family transposase [Candidatus Tisiphia endosymbiont of Hybos culiciformis]|uniref:IS701 family transposase n=2 Tax=Candidatus Tisiphia endosymbiont of Hybos culiciformis TaxID=3139331 RepID=UPI003CCB1554